MSSRVVADTNKWKGPNNEKSRLFSILHVLSFGRENEQRGCRIAWHLPFVLSVELTIPGVVVNSKQLAHCKGELTLRPH